MSEKGQHNLQCPQRISDALINKLITCYTDKEECDIVVLNMPEPDDPARVTIAQAKKGCYVAAFIHFPRYVNDTVGMFEIHEATTKEEVQILIEQIRGDLDSKFPTYKEYPCWVDFNNIMDMLHNKYA